MALYQGVSLEDLEEEEGNKYLDDPKMGIGLIKSLLLRKKEKKERTEFEHIIQDEIFPVLAELELPNELEIYKELVKIGDKLKEYHVLRLLEGKQVLGVGGKFSAGKSCFINSITNAQLPEGQRPTTSIATYIVNDEKKDHAAISYSDTMIHLDEEALEALTHQFYERYQIGFSKFVRNLVIHTPNFTYPNIAVLDTPGYSKSDISKQEDSSDAEQARAQLRTADYLIWLIDAVQGVVTQRDLEFLSSLPVSTGILVVFTKAGCEGESNLHKKIEQAKEALKGIDKEIYDVIAYDSLDVQTLVGGDALENFLDMVNQSGVLKEGLAGQIREIFDQLEDQLDEQVEECVNKYRALDSILQKTNNVEHISAVVEEHGKCRTQLARLKENKKLLKTGCFRLLQITDKMNKSKAAEEMYEPNFTA